MQSTRVPYSFTLTRRDAATRDWLSINRAWRIALPVGVVAGRGVGQYRRAHLYWDAANRTIAMIFTVDGAEMTAYPLRFVAGGAAVESRRFFVSNRLHANDLAGRYPFRVLPAQELGVESDGDAFLIQLREKLVVSR